MPPGFSLVVFSKFLEISSSRPHEIFASINTVRPDHWKAPKGSTTMNILKSATVRSVWCLVVIAFSTTIIAAEDETTTEEDGSSSATPCLRSDDFVVYFTSQTGCDWTALEAATLQEMKHKAPNCQHGVQRELQLLTGMS